MGRKATILKAGDKVIIPQNPHHPGVDGIVGTVVVYRPSEGFAVRRPVSC